MKYSIVSVKNLNNEYRLDAEYFSPEILVVEKNLSKHKTEIISNFARVIHPTEIERIYTDSGLQMVLAQNVRSNNLCMDLKFCMSQNLQNILSNNLLDYDDVLITRTGANFGQTAPFKFKDKMYACADLLVVKCNQILGGYLSTFLNTKYGRLILDRGVYGAAQPHISASYIKQLTIPRFTQKFERLIDNLLNKTFNNNILQEKFYNKAKNILLDELNIENWSPMHKLWSVKNYSDVKDANRLDAEYFQLKYDEVIKSIKNYFNGYDKLKNMVKIKDINFIPKSKDEYKYIELANIAKSGEINDCTVDFGENLPTRARRIVSTGDVVVSSIEGSLDSVALITSDNNNALCSTGFYVINSNSINSETLFCLMKSEFIQMQLKRGCSGTILTAINKDEFENIILPKINNNVQIQIKENIQEMYKLKCQSKQLLEIAKRGVEIAIEQDEDIATDWINQELQKIGVEL